MGCCHILFFRRDEWFAESMKCACCEGYIYRCKQQQSACSSGNCVCALDNGNLKQSFAAAGARSPTNKQTQ